MIIENIVKNNEPHLALYAEDNGFNIPKPIILDENLNGFEAKEKEEYWVNFYKTKNYNVINIAKTGVKSSSIGGSIKKHPFSLDNALQLAQATKQLKEKEGGSLLITTSRRTGIEAQNLIMENLKDIPHYAYLWGAEGKNPYLGFLSCADNLIVTGDSVSMCCEATATQKPLRIFTGSNWLTDKHIRFVQSLYQQKVAQDIFSQESSVTQQTKLNIAKEIADKISEL